MDRLQHIAKNVPLRLLLPKALLVFKAFLDVRTVFERFTEEFAEKSIDMARDCSYKIQHGRGPGLQRVSPIDESEGSRTYELTRESCTLYAI